MSLISDITRLDPQAVYTYADYLRWRLRERVELLNGKFHYMSPAPNRKHQRVLRGLMRSLLPFFPAASRCELYCAPFDVRLYDAQKSQASEAEIITVLQPDLVVVCDKTKLDEKGCMGAPDLIVEILSPGFFKLDLSEKKALYEESGVREYWVVFPEAEMVERYVLDENGFFGMPIKFFGEDTLESKIFADLSIELRAVFDE